MRKSKRYSPRSQALKKRENHTEVTQERLRQIDLVSIRPSPENEQLYKPVNRNDPAIKALAESIRARGIIDPLVITQDFWIISGHRRFVAATLVCLEQVPCRVYPF